jgi:hypothetical protein
MKDIAFMESIQNANREYEERLFIYENTRSVKYKQTEEKILEIQLYLRDEIRLRAHMKFYDLVCVIEKIIPIDFLNTIVERAKQYINDVELNKYVYFPYTENLPSFRGYSYRIRIYLYQFIGLIEN